MRCGLRRALWPTLLLLLLAAHVRAQLAQLDGGRGRDEVWEDETIPRQVSGGEGRGGGGEERAEHCDIIPSSSPFTLQTVFHLARLRREEQQESRGAVWQDIYNLPLRNKARTSSAWLLNLVLYTGFLFFIQYLAQEVGHTGFWIELKIEGESIKFRVLHPLC